MGRGDVQTKKNFGGGGVTPILREIISFAGGWVKFTVNFNLKLCEFEIEFSRSAHEGGDGRG